MPTSYTSLIGLALPVTGELSGTWGDTVNNYITNYLDSAVAGTQTISGSQTAVALGVTNGSSLVTAGSGATGSAQFQIINCTGNPAGLLTITAPASSRQYIIINATSTSQSVKIVGAGPTTGVTLISGEKAHVAWNGSDFVKVATTAAAGGSNTQVQYNSSGVLAGSSNLTFDGTNLTVGGTASATKLIPTGGAATGNGMYLPAANTLAWSNNGSETMRLDSSGNLGLGVTPSAWSVPAGKPIEVGTVGNSIWGVGASNMVIGANFYYASSSYKYANTGSAASAYQQAGGVHYWYNAASGTAGNNISFTETMRLNSSGNLGLGVTPSAWSQGKGFEVFSAGYGLWNGSGAPASIYVTANAYYNSGFKYGENGQASHYYQYLGQHVWSTAASGTAGNAITFTQAMTLDTSGRLLIGATSGSRKLEVHTANGTETAILLNQSGVGAATLFVPASTNALSFGVLDGGSGNVTERARITSGGNFQLTSGGQIELNVSTLSSKGAIAAFNTDSTNGGLVFKTESSGTLAERARITSAGYFKASNNGTYTGGSTSQAHEFNQSVDNNTLIVFGTNATLSTSGIVFLEAARNTTNNSFYAFSYYNSGAAAYKFRVADSGNVTNTNGSYGTISDVKMKTDIVDAGSQWNDIKAIRFRKFKMKDDPSGLLQLGVVAQELEQTSPGLVDEHTDRDAEGNDLGTTTKSVKTSVLLMKAAVALQEAMARIEQLEAKVAALESKGA